MPQTAQKEIKALACPDLKTFDREDGTGGLEGYASIKGNIDAYNDVIANNAYVGLDRLVKAGFAASGHDWSGPPIGIIEDAREDANGLFVRVKYHSTPEAQNMRKVVAERIAAGKEVGMSIGYYTRKSADVVYQGVPVRELQEIEVFEVSVVNMPANSAATVLSAKAAGRTFADQRSTLLAEVGDFTARVKGLAEVRERGLSDEKQAEIQEVLTAYGYATAQLTELVSAGVTPKESIATPDQLAELEAVFAEIAKN